jgi:hypothetical protein
MRYVRTNDRLSSQTKTPQRPDLAPVLGAWFNCNPRTGEILRLDLAGRGDGLTLRAFGADEASPIDWGETPAEPHVAMIGSSEVTGFTAHYNFGFMETQIAANIKYGVMVIQSYNRFVDGSGRPCYFSREFFHQIPDGSKTRISRSADLAPGLPYRMTSDRPASTPQRGDGVVDLGPLLGSWRNTYPNSKGIASIQLSRGPDGFEVQASGVRCDEDWGRVPAVPHAATVSGQEPAGFLARYDFGFSEVLLSSNESKGLLIIASFTMFQDESGRSNYFTREFFYREAPGARTS